MPGEGVVAGSQAAGALPSLVTLRARVYAALRDSEMSYIEPWFVDQLLNEAYLDLNARLRLKKVTATGTTSSTGTLDYPTDLVELQNLRIEGITPEFVDDDTYWSFASRGGIPYGAGGTATTLARVNGLTIETYPAVTFGDYSLEYVARPAEMVAESDTPDELTIELVPRIVHFARAHGKFAQSESEEGGAYMAMYEQGLPGAPREAFRRRVGPMSLIPEPGPFDLQDQ
jgi:hypothetical protein